MYRYLERRLVEHLREFLRRSYGLEVANIVVEQPPKIEFGEYALPLAFELARKLRKAPRKIAEEIVAGVGAIPGFDKFEAAGGGFINVRVNRAGLATELAADRAPSTDVPPGKVLVEHSSINPNKAAHIGHLRNAILGDTFVRLLRFAGREVDVQNYIDNTGVQVADVVVGLVYIKKLATLAQVKEYLARRHIGKKQYAGDEFGNVVLDQYLSVKTEDLPRDPVTIDYEMWDLYARVSDWYDAPGEEQRRKPLRSQVLHAIEEGGNQLAEIAEFVSTEILKRHLETMERLDIEYDFLPRESEILHLHFWDAAFTKLKESGVLVLETQGKNKDCWVMRRPGTGSAEDTRKVEFKQEDLRVDSYRSQTGKTAVRIMHIPTGAEATSESEGSEQANHECAMNRLRPRVREIEGQKVIVRSNETVGYVGKDIAYHMWKFGLLGRDFGYRKFYYYERDPKGHFQPQGQWCWISTTDGERDHPHFGDVAEIYNVIDHRQAEAQNTVIEALRGLGHGEAADRYTHFSYEIVALTPRCAAELGYTLSEEDKGKPWIEVSGRKGFGVKADDMLDALIGAAGKEVDARHPELSAAERSTIATQIAIGALRYFMLKFTKNSVIAFDFKDALSFEGDTGPYAQYAVVRASNIFRKGGLDPESFGGSIGRAMGRAEDFATYLSGESGNEVWELWLAAAKTSYVVGQSIATAEPAHLAKHAFQLAQLFNTFYHRYPILSETDEGRKNFLLATAGVVRRELIRVLGMMGIGAPRMM